MSFHLHLHWRASDVQAGKLLGSAR